MSRGLDLAAKHIEAAGGPKFNYTYIDHKSGDAAAGDAGDDRARLARASRPSSRPTSTTSARCSPAPRENKMFTLDGGGGTSIFGQGQPYFWGTRAITPNDPMPGLFQ